MTLIALMRAGAIAALLGSVAVSAANAFDDIDALPEGPGKEDTFYNCIACHSFQVVTRQGMTQAMWDNTLTLMVERHGMPELLPEERELILHYLVEHFPPAAAGDTGTGRRGWVNPFGTN
jgi:hypothetical protein